MRFRVSCVALFTIFVAALLIGTAMAPSSDIFGTSRTLTRATEATAFGNAQGNDDVFWTTRETSIQTTDNFFPGTQTITKGTQTAGTYPDCVNTLNNDVRCTWQEADQAPADSPLDPDTQTLTKALDCGGVFPGDLTTSNNVYVCRREQDQAVSIQLDPDAETVNLGTKVSGVFPTDVISDNGVAILYREANQAITGTIAFDAAAESERIGTTDPHTWTHTPVGTPRAVAVAIVHGTSSTDHVLTVTYGGVSMTEIVRATDTATEPGASELWFLGAGIPTGAQTVSADLATATTDDIHFVSISFTASSDTEVIDSDFINENAANPSRVLQFVGRRAVAVEALYSGLAAPPANSCSGSSACTLVHLFDIGAFGSTVDRQTTAGTTDQTMGYTSGADDVAFVTMAMTEIATAPDYELQVTYDHTPAETCADTRRLTVNSWRANANMENVDIQVVDSTEVTWTTRITVTATADGTTQTYDLTVDEWDAGLPNFRFKDTTTAGDSLQGDFNVDLAVINCVGAADFELEYRIDWTAEVCANAARTLRVEAFMSAGAGTENILAQVGTFPGPTFNTRITITATVDPNTYQTYTLLDAEWNSGAPAVRFLGNQEAADTTQTDLSIDDLEVLCQPTNDFELEVRYSWTGVPTSGVEWRLFVEGREGTNLEQLDIRIFAADDIALSAIVCSITATLEAEYDCGTLTTDQLDAGSPDIQLVDQNQTLDTAQSTVDLDTLRIRRTIDNYQIEVQVDWVATLDPAATSWTLNIRWRRSGDTETISLQVLTWPSTFTTRLSLTSATEILDTYALLAAEVSAAGDARILFLQAADDQDQTTLDVDDLFIQQVTPDGGEEEPAAPDDTGSGAVRLTGSSAPITCLPLSFLGAVRCTDTSNQSFMLVSHVEWYVNGQLRTISAPGATVWLMIGGAESVTVGIKLILVNPEVAKPFAEIVVLLPSANRSAIWIIVLSVPAAAFVLLWRRP